MATRSGMPARTMLRMAVRRKSCVMRPGHPAASSPSGCLNHAVAVRADATRRPWHHPYLLRGLIRCRLMATPSLFSDSLETFLGVQGRPKSTP
jgi:hypothetical protein